RAAVVIGKTVNVNAVKRNKLKRQIHASIDRIDKLNPIKGIKFIVRIFKYLVDSKITNEWLDAEIEKCLKSWR
ncbi:MAG: hypothetical protein CEN91_589, partial [Candidatus Berkelbacteria bacterium Licking1014_85]